MSRAKALAGVISALVDHTKRYYGDRLVGILQFGSTVNQIKPVTDLDLLIVVGDLSSDRQVRDQEWLKVEALLEGELQWARSEGLHLALSPIIKTPDEASRFQSYYLDFPDCSVVLYDPRQFMEKLIERTRYYIHDSGAVKKQVGSLWYWDLAPGATYKDIRKIGW